MKIAIAGGSGFVGRALSDFFIKNGDEVFILSRQTKTSSSHPHLKYIQWLTPNNNVASLLNGVDVIINLAGESINSGRWNQARKERILKSRLEATNELLKIISILKQKPKVFLNASAIGFYGTSETITFTEDSNSIGADFLSEVVKKWEGLALQAETFGVRTIVCRLGIVLDKSGGALPKMILPYKVFAGGKLGKGKQWVSWIHIEDVIKAISFIIKQEKINGPVNFVTPNPVQMNDFGKTIAQTLHRPHWLPTPEFALKLLLGEMSLLMLEGQKVLPNQLLKHGYHFSFPTLDKALYNIFQS